MIVRDELPHVLEELDFCNPHILPLLVHILHRTFLNRKKIILLYLYFHYFCTAQNTARRVASLAHIRHDKECKCVVLYHADNHVISRQSTSEFLISVVSLRPSMSPAADTSRTHRIPALRWMTVFAAETVIVETVIVETVTVEAVIVKKV